MCACLSNLALPEIIYERILETYRLIFENLKINNENDWIRELAEELNIYSLGLFSFSKTASAKVKKKKEYFLIKKKS